MLAGEVVGRVGVGGLVGSWRRGEGRSRLRIGGGGLAVAGVGRVGWLLDAGGRVWNGRVSDGMAWDLSATEASTWGTRPSTRTVTTTRVVKYRAEMGRRHGRTWIGRRRVGLDDFLEWRVPLLAFFNGH